MKKLITLLTVTVISGFVFSKTITVTSSADSGVGTLRQAVLDASANDTINFASNVTTVVLSNQLIFNKNLTVNGNPTTKTIISVAAGYYLWEFIIQKGMKVVVNYLSFRDANVVSTCAGAVVNYGTLIVSNSFFVNNKTNSSGAALYNSIGGELYIEKSKFNNNESGSRGGALEAASNTKTYITDCEFENNIGQIGSAISNFGNMTVRNSILSKNININSSSIVGAGYGTVYSEKGNIDIINCIFNLNSGVYCSAFANNKSSKAFVINTLFASNTCASNTLSSTIYNDIQKDSVSTLTLVNNTIANNNAIGVYNNNGTSVLYNNILQNDTIDIYATNSGIITAANNLIGNANINLLGNGNILSTDPLFIGSGDYTLQKTSPAINHGNNSFLPDTILIDLLGKVRFTGTSIDLGAYEYQSASADILQKYNSKPKIYSQNHNIYVANASSAVCIYNVTGELIAQGNSPVFSVSETGVYLVKIGNTVQKVIVK